MSINKRIDHWKSLYNPNPMCREIRYIIDYPNLNNPMPVLNADNKQKRIDWAKRLYEWQIKNVEYYDDDSLPHLYPMTGTEIIAEAFGCDVYYPENTLPSARPLVFDSDAASKLKVPKLEETPLMMLFDIVDELRNWAGNDALIRLPDVQSPMGTVALIWDKNDLYITMIENPKAVLELAKKVKELFVTFMDEWFKRYGTTFIAHFPAYYMEGGISLSTCETVCISPQMYDDYFAGEINTLSRHYGGLGIHCCGEQKKHWESIKKTDGLKFLNLGVPSDQIFKAFDFFKDTCIQMHYKHLEEGSVIAPDEINKLPDVCRVVLPLNAENLEHAKKLSEVYGKYRT